MPPGVRVLYASGDTDDEVGRHVVGAERGHFLRKPFTPLTRAQKVREVRDAPA